MEYLPPDLKGKLDLPWRKFLIPSELKPRQVLEKKKRD